MQSDSAGDASFEEAAACVAQYHEHQLSLIVNHLRDGLVSLDAGEIDVFEFDSIVHHYKRAANELWKTCSVGGQQLRRLARLIAEEEGEPTDWWALSESKRSR